MVSPWEFLSDPPGSAVFVLCVSTLMSFILYLVRLRFTSKEELEQLNAWNQEIQTWTTNLNKAKRSGDKKMLKRLRKQEKRIKQLQSKVASQQLRQMKTIPISMVLIIPFWVILTGRIPLPIFYNIELFPAPFSVSEVVAYLPWFGKSWELNFISWYLLCSLTAGVLIPHVLGETKEETE